MTEILPSFDCDSFIDCYKKEKGQGPDELKSSLEATMVYQEKHYERIEKHLKNSYFVDYIVSQMTLEKDEGIS